MQSTDGTLLSCHDDKPRPELTHLSISRPSLPAGSGAFRRIRCWVMATSKSTQRGQPLSIRRLPELGRWQESRMHETCLSAPWCAAPRPSVLATPVLDRRSDQKAVAATTLSSFTSARVSTVIRASPFSVNLSVECEAHRPCARIGLHIWSSIEARPKRSVCWRPGNGKIRRTRRDYLVAQRQSTYLPTKPDTR